MYSKTLDVTKTIKNDFQCRTYLSRKTKLAQMRPNLSLIEGYPQESYISGDDVIVTDGGQVQENARLEEGKGDPSVADDSAVGQGNDVRPHVLLEGIPQASFMIGTDGAIRAWNHDMAAFTGISADEALGRADIGMMLYNNDDDTMIEQVLAAPKTADEVYGLDVEDPSRNLYVKEDRVADHSGNVEHYARVTVMPIYEDGELMGAVEMLQDLTEERRRQEVTEGLVDEVSGTLRALANGDLDARASFTDSDVINSQLLDVVEEVNGMADNLQDIVLDVDQQATRLGDSVKRAVTAADDIADNVDEQNELLTESVEEMSTFSANMEEVAATAEQVDGSAKRAREAANEGLDASSDAHTATDEVIEIGDELVDSITELGERMDDIENVVEVISEVADQTNMLALNANIEAARAGKDGDGFAVVADEVKTLANETRQHTEQITKDIDRLQAQTDETIDAAEESHQQIVTASDQIEDVLTAFEDIATAIEETADGIGEVSRATDDQAATVEELTATLETAREHASDTEAAADEIVAATDDQTQAISELDSRVQRLRGNQ